MVWNLAQESYMNHFYGPFIVLHCMEKSTHKNISFSVLHNKESRTGVGELSL